MKYSQKIQIREILNCISTGKIDTAEDGYKDGKREISKSELMDYKKTAGRYGLAVTGDGLLAVRCNHHEIMKIIRKGKGYHRQLKRHKGYIEIKNVSICGATERCVIISGVIDDGIPF